MKAIFRTKKIILSILGIAVAFITKGHTEPQNQVNNTDEAFIKKQEEYIGENFSEKELIQCLKELKRNPEDVKVVSAMCYKMALSPQELEYQCPECGQKTIHSWQKGKGKLVQALPYIRRSLEQMPYKIHVDSKGLCRKCSEEKDAGLIMNVECFNCGKHFSWNVENKDDIELLHWLYISPPFKEIDGHYLGLWNNKDQESKKKISEGINYIMNHVFCPECRNQLKSEE